MFASSVSRNLDQLTLDEDHIAMRKKQRRKVPDRVTDGLIQGLSGFGISLLGKNNSFICLLSFYFCKINVNGLTFQT